MQGDGGRSPLPLHSTGTYNFGTISPVVRCFSSVSGSHGDYCNYNSSGVVLYVGGNYNQNQNHGAFYLNGNYTASNSNSNIGCRLLSNGPRLARTLRRKALPGFT